MLLFAQKVSAGICPLAPKERRTIALAAGQGREHEESKAPPGRRNRPAADYSALAGLPRIGANVTLASGQGFRTVGPPGLHFWRQTPTGFPNPAQRSHASCAPWGIPHACESES